MARASVAPQRSRSTLIGAVSVVAVVAVIATLAVTAEGYDAQKTPRLDASVWVTRDDGQYARVNTDLGEIDTVRSVDEPSRVIQAGATAFVLAQSDRLLWPVSSADPRDFAAAEGADGEDQADSLFTPSGTRAVSTGGTFIAYLTDTGKVFLGTIPTPDAPVDDPSLTVSIDPFAADADEDDPDAPSYEATAVAVSDLGLLYLYSSAEKGIRRYDANTHEFVGGLVTIDSPPDADAALELAVIGERWVLSEPAESRIWTTDVTGPVDTGLAAGAVMQSSDSTAELVYLADSRGLSAIDLSSGDASPIIDATGTPAPPVVVDGIVYAAWLTTSGGSLWSSETSELTSLPTEGDTLEEVREVVPVFRSNGSRAVLSETSSGLLWTVPDGALIPIEQWSLDDKKLDAGTVKVDDVAEQEPPVAVADTLGVRAGELVRLPLLLNDHDPNKKDVLTIDPTSIASAAADHSFGDLGLISNNQEAVIRVRASAGSTTFTYAVTDGYATSVPVTVTLTVIPPDQNTAPVWCGIDGCTQEWPTPQVAPGGSIKLSVLAGWVDAEGDPIVLTDARKDKADDPVTVVPTADGSVAIRHPDPNAAGGPVPITVSVSDARGATATKTLELLVTANPALTIEPVAIVAGVGEKATIQIADHVSGGSGSYRLLDAATVADGLLVVPNAAAGSIELTAAAAGSYSLTFTVQDSLELTEQSAVARVTVAGGEVSLTMAPLTTFVRANEDTTVDVLGAVQNTTGRVLLVSSALSGDPALSVSVVGQSSVRVSGSTPDGLPGRIGSALISITDGAGATVEGFLTVFLAPPSTGVGPIAVPDTVTVRAGGQIDIPVTRNDVSPRGERLLVDPKVEMSDADGELAFVSGDAVRYLAPAKDGVYTLRYSVYLSNEPSKTDTATITVTVLPAGANRDPQPPILAAHVLSGQTVSIKVDGYGMDPDGDAVVLAGVEQPKGGQGVASISADGTAILYTAPGNGISGSQVGFTYRVRDTQGAEATGSVRVGVLDEELADSAPVTYSDYIRTQVGAETAVTVLPLLNDSDPSAGELELISLVPNTPAVDTNPEYARLESLVADGTSLENGVVMLNAGDVLGTHSYVYTVGSSVSTSNQNGLIVVTVADEGAPDHPEVTDTVLTARNRGQLTSGIDVVNGKVQWPTGDVSSLVLKLWGNPSGFSVSGHSILGAVPKRETLVPFSLSGKDSAGNSVTSYGFLRIPAFNDMRLQLRQTFAPIEVGEEKSVEFDVLDVLDVDSADNVQIRDEDSYVVQRANSTCEPSGATSATYTAGREAPWTDYCAMPVRLEGQSEWTILAVPINIAPKDPLAQLNAVTRAIAPGESDSLDLYEDMTSWQGGRVGDETILDYAHVYSGASFVVNRVGTLVTIDARADAKPGTRENISISVTSYGGLTSTITLLVGIAAPDTPRGATFTHQCDVRTGASCSIVVIGEAGEYDPFAGKVGAGITLVSIGAGSPVSCAVANIAASGDTRIVASYPAGPKPAGGECIVPFTVKDAQGRVGIGQLTIDILGYPAKPSSTTTTGYSGSSVTLAVTLGEAAQAHPSVTEVTIWEGASQVPASCNPVGANYQCTVSSLVNGENHLFTARARNNIGESLDTSAVSTNAYQAPSVAGFTASPIYDSQTTTGVARVELNITSDSDTKSFRVLNNGQTILRGGSVTTSVISIAPGSGPVRIVPISQFQPPVGAAGNEGSQKNAPVNAIGAPSFNSGPSATAKSDNEILVAGADVNPNYAPSYTRVYFAWRGSNAPVCTATTTGDLSYSGGEASSTTSTITVPDSYDSYNVMVCATTQYGVAVSPVASVFAGKILPAPPGGDLNYTVSPVPDGDGTLRVTYLDFSGPHPTGAPPKFTLYYQIDAGTPTTNFELFAERNSIPVVKYCANRAPTFCSNSTPLVPQTSWTTATIDFPSSCVVTPSENDPRFSQGAASHATVTYDTSLFPFTVTYHVSWDNGLNSVSSAPVPICTP